MHYLLFYELVDDYKERRAEFRNRHLAMAWESCDRGEMELAGALANPTDMAILLFRGESREAAENFAKNDPYVLNGLVKRWYIREWTTVVGEKCSVPAWPQ